MTLIPLSSLSSLYLHAHKMHDTIATTQLDASLIFANLSPHSFFAHTQHAHWYGMASTDMAISASNRASPQYLPFPMCAPPQLPPTLNAQRVQYRYL